MGNQQDASLLERSGSLINTRNDISDGEKNYIKQRNEIIQDCLLKHGIDCRLDEVPRIAVLGSGGGQRAQIALLGTLRQLAEENLLDSVMYLGGVSGSTWSISTLYKDPTWSASDGVKALIDRELSRLSKKTPVSFTDSVQWLRSRDEEGDLSLTDVWAILIAYHFTKEINTHILSEEAVRDATNPYPNYNCIEKDCFLRKSAQDAWFEMGPRECGFSTLGAFVETSFLKSHFDDGRKIPSNAKPMDMNQLQGICGSCMADGKKDVEEIEKRIDFITNLIWKWIKSHSTGKRLNLREESEANFRSDSGGKAPTVHDIVMKVVQLMDSKDTEHSFEAIASLKSLLGDKCGDSSPTLLKMDLETWKRKNEMEREQLAHKIGSEMISSSDGWSEGLEDLSDVCWVVKHIFPLIKLLCKWEFGTMANFLYNMTSSEIPEVMKAEDKMHLMDAGLLLNSPYPPFLRPERGVDLIISFDFSEGDPFETIKEASKYASAINRPFPKVDVPNTDYPESFYVFEGKELTVIHVPLFNMDNCKDKEGIDMEWSEYKTFQPPWSDEKKIQHLADLAAENVKINREKILSQIKIATECKKKTFWTRTCTCS